MADPVGLAVLLAEVVREGLAVKGWTQADLARAAGLSQKHVSLVLQGKAPASVVTWDHLLRLVWPDP